MEDIIIDYCTGKALPDVGAEGSRQLFEKILVDKKGYPKSDIKVDEEIRTLFKGEEYISSIDLVVFCNEKAFMAIRCIAGSLDSYQREILAGARLLYDYQIPLAVSTNGIDASIWDTLSGKSFGQGIDAVPSREEAEIFLKNYTFEVFPEKKREREMILFRSFSMERYYDECTGSYRR